MNRLNTLLSILLIWASSISARDISFTFEGQTVNYTVIDEEAKTVETKESFVTKLHDWIPGNEIVGDLIIPPTITVGDTVFSVIRIGKESFAQSKELKSVKLPDSILEIGASAFSLSSLSDINLPASINKIENGAFYSTEIQSIEWPEACKEILKGVFSNCKNLYEVIIPSSVELIENNAFYQCSLLTSIPLPDSLTNIGDEAFAFCSSLESISITNSISEIGWGACRGCTS